MNFNSNTDVGRVRENNEDSYSNYISPDYSLHIVADGMGGHSAGEIASSLAVQYIEDYIKNNFNKNEIFDTIVEAIKHAHKHIIKLASDTPELKGMGTTVILSLIYEDNLYYANIGDSRIYLYSNNEMIQITKDHSYVQELIDAGVITEEEAKFYPRNQITSALGTEMNYKVDIDKLPLSTNDTILMTTDGLTDLIDDNDIYDVLKMEYSPEDITEILTYMANSTGGKDNITITCIRID